MLSGGLVVAVGVRHCSIAGFDFDEIDKIIKSIENGGATILCLSD